MMHEPDSGHKSATDLDESRTAMIANAMTVDVEDYFHVSAFEKYINNDSWDNLQCRVDHNTNRILDIFSNYNVTATFFVLGWVAQRYPSLVRRIVDEGHELASHGYMHTRVFNQSRSEFREDVMKTKMLLEDISGSEVKGYRAASYSIGRDNLWALEILHDTGHVYSSSIYPVKHDLYGIPDAPRFPYNPIDGSAILEIPISTIRILGRNIPIGGGGYFRFYPYLLSRKAISHVNRSERRPVIFYFHPWEIDPNQPRQERVDARTRFRHYLNLDRMETRIERLVCDFSWNSIEKIFLGRDGQAVR